MSDSVAPPTITGTKRKSRFEDASSSNATVQPASAPTTSGVDGQPPSKRLATGIDLSAAAAKAAEISREMASKLTASIPASIPTSATSNPAVLSALAQAQLRAQLAAQEKKISMLAQIRPLLLDSQGREIDEKGNLITPTTIAPIKTIAINTNLASASVSTSNVTSSANVPPKKKENPYLAHRQITAPTTVESAAPDKASLSTGTEPTSATTAISIPPPAPESTILDDRIVLKDRHRSSRLKKALHFVEPGTFIAQEEAWKMKENQKMLSGYASGRKHVHRQLMNDNNNSDIDSSDEEDSEEDEKIPFYMKDVPPMLPDLSPVVTIHDDDENAHWYNRDQLEDLLPNLEWWDVCFLPKLQREQHRSSTVQSIMSFPQSTKKNEETARAVDTVKETTDEYALLSVQHCKTVAYVQHPPPFLHSHSHLTANKAPLIVPTYLTKAERKKLRKATRAEREKVKREQQMLGLIPAPEPKFKLSNFMKILGDTAVSDPSKVEKKVVEQIQKRMLNHAMRNLAAKLTPAERKQKRLLQLQQDNLLVPGQSQNSNRLLHMAVYRVTDFECTKYQYKVDVHAQQWLLSGTAVLCHIYKPVKKTNPADIHVDGKHKDNGQEAEEEKEMELVDQMNLVVVEGGVKSMRKFEKLMLKRIRWTEFIPAKKQVPVEDEQATKEDKDDGDESAMYPPGYLEALRAKEQQQEATGAEDSNGMDNDPSHDAEEGREGMNVDEEEGDDGSDSEDEEDDEEDDESVKGPNHSNLETTGLDVQGTTHQQAHYHNMHPAHPLGLLAGPIQHRPSAKCELMWQGETAKRLFHGFKFQAVTSLAAAKQYCDQKQIGHFWDMMMQVEKKERAKNKDNSKKKKQATQEVEGDAEENESVGDIFDADFWG